MLIKGNRIQDTLVLMLETITLKGLNESISVSLMVTTADDVVAGLHELLSSEPPDTLPQSVTVSYFCRM